MFNTIKFTPAMQFVLHSVLSLCIGGAVSGLTVVGQGVFATGTDPKVTLGAGLAACISWFVHGFVSLAHNPQTAQAENDVLSEVKSTVGQLLTSHQALASIVRTMQQAPVAQPASQQRPMTPQPVMMQSPQVPLSNMVASGGGYGMSSYPQGNIPVFDLGTQQVQTPGQSWQPTQPGHGG